MQSTSEGRKRSTVLIVEDDEDLCSSLADGLQRFGYNVVTAGTADEALEWAQRTDVTIDVTVLDIVLPDSWGSQVALSHTAFQPNTRFVYMSGHARDDAVLRATANIDQVPFLEKPFDVTELAGLIQEVLEDPAQELLEG